MLKVVSFSTDYISIQFYLSWIEIKILNFILGLKICSLKHGNNGHFVQKLNFEKYIFNQKIK